MDQTMLDSHLETRQIAITIHGDENETHVQKLSSELRNLSYSGQLFNKNPLQNIYNRPPRCTVRIDYSTELNFDSHQQLLHIHIRFTILATFDPKRKLLRKPLSTRYRHVPCTMCTMMRPGHNTIH